MQNIVLAAALLLLGWGFGYEAEVNRLAIFMKWQQVGSSQDFFLAKYNIAGEWERVAAVFGYANDGEACLELADALMTQYPANRYICWPVN